MNSEKIEDCFPELISYLKEKSGEHNMPIERQTLIEDDLGVTGEDAYDLIVQISKMYQIDITGFDFAKYFNDEPLIFLSDRMVLPFTVGHLEKAIIAGRLNDEIVNSDGE
jgi:hypothetical protein